MLQAGAKVGFLGLGIMGEAMAANLVRAGFEVVVYNRTASRCAALVAAGARQAATPAEVVAECPITFAIVSDPAAAEALCFGPEGVRKGIPAGHGYVDMSTIDAATSKRIGEAICAKGARYLEAPVSGSKGPAETGQLIILAAGDQSLYDEAMPAFSVMGKQTLHLGEVGQGARMKLIVNMIMGAMMTAFSEGLGLAQASGLAPRDLLAVLDQGAISNPMFRAKGPSMLEGQFAPAFPLKHMQKDLRLALLLADELAHSMPTAAAANESFKKARQLGATDEDFSAVFKAFSL